MKIRSCVLKFAKAMEAALSHHDKDRGPRGWASDAFEDLLVRLQEEARELDLAIAKYRVANPHAAAVRLADIRKEAADVGNFAMMIHDLSR